MKSTGDNAINIVIRSLQSPDAVISISPSAAILELKHLIAQVLHPRNLVETKYSPYTAKTNISW